MITAARRRLATLVLLAAVGALGIATTATGHYTQAVHGNDLAWVDYTHDHLDVEDNECDGNRVYARGNDASGARGPKYDPDGCGGSWGHLDGVNFTSYEVCEEGVSCSNRVGT